MRPLRLLLLVGLLVLAIADCSDGTPTLPADADATLRALLERYRSGSSHVKYRLQNEGFDNPPLDWEIEWRNIGVDREKLQAKSKGSDGEMVDLNLIMTTKSGIIVCAERADAFRSVAGPPDRAVCVQGAPASDAADVAYLVSGLPLPPSTTEQATAPIDLSDVTIERVSIRNYASERATCYGFAGDERDDAGRVETCFADDGTLLFRETRSRLGRRTLAATQVFSEPVTDADFALPYPLVKID